MGSDAVVVAVVRLCGLTLRAQGQPESLSQLRLANFRTAVTIRLPTTSCHHRLCASARIRSAATRVH